MKVELKDVTIICVDTKFYGQSLRALKECISQVTPARCLFLTDIEFDAGEGIEVVKIPKISSKRQYSEFIIKELYKYFDTSHCLIVQWDGFIINPSVWTDEFLTVDYIGAPWNYDSDRTVGNGGFSARSHKLCKILGEDDFIDVLHPEDQSICIIYKYYLEEKYRIKFASKELASKFAYETIAPTAPTFGFHNYGQPAFKEHIVIQREASMGDILMCEPIIQYYHDKGYQVVLDTQPQFMSLFFQHPFRVMHISQMNPAIVPREIIDLNMAYELKPKIPVLQAYCEKAGIDIPLRNSRLNVYADQKMFKKLAVIHDDDTGLPHRNLNWVNWMCIVEDLERRGYTVLQIGKRTKKEIATYFNTFTIEFLMFFLKGADLFIGMDSGNAQIAVALGVPSIIMSGSVDLRLRYNDFSNIIPIQGECEKKETAFCYHTEIGSTTGKECIYNPTLPPCTRYDTLNIINAINHFECTSVRLTKQENS